jgi:integrase/recombinase XerD
MVYLASELGLADNSLLAYRRDLQSAEGFLSSRQLTLRTADEDDFRAYVQSQTHCGKATTTIRRRVAAIRMWMRFSTLGHHGIPDQLEYLDSPKPPHRLPRVLSKTQVKLLIGAPDPKSRFFSRDVAILELLYASGVRASELCDLGVKDVNLRSGTVRVMGKGRKERMVVIGRAAIEAIDRYVSRSRAEFDRWHSGRLFLSRSGRPMDRVGLWILVERHARRCGLLRQVSPNTLRHCFATHMIGGGADLRIVQELLGHSDINTTQVYMHVDRSWAKAVHQRFHPRG